MKKGKKIKITILFFLLAALTAGFLEHQRRTNRFFADSNDFEHLAKHVYFAAQEIMPKKEPTNVLDIKFHRQEHSLSCEIAALKAILDWRGLAISENELLKSLAFSERGPRQAGNIWGDPDLGFVGDIDGSMPNIGYGVYEKPIYELSIKFRNAQIPENATLTQLIDELQAGNPSIVWGISGSRKDISWKTKEGKIIKAVMGEHTRVLMGFTGTKEQPKEIILMDPLYGKITLKVDDFLKDWAILGNKAIVVF